MSVNIATNGHCCPEVGETSGKQFPIVTSTPVTICILTRGQGISSLRRKSKTSQSHETTEYVFIKYKRPHLGQLHREWVSERAVS